MIHWLTCLSNVKDFLNDSGTGYDRLLEQYIQIASDDIERYCDRRLRERTYGANGLDAEYQDGDGCKYLYTREKPILSVTSLYDDPDNVYGSDTLFASTDYHIFKDIGKILLLGDSSLGSAFSVGNANIKIIYTAGYGTYEIITGRNDKIDFNESVGGTALVATLTAGTYTADDMATEVKTQLDAATGGTGVYTVTFDRYSFKFTVKTSLTYEGFLWLSGTNVRNSAGRTIGFDVSADDVTAATATYTSDYGVMGIPGDLEMACQMLVARYFYASKKGKDRFDVKSVSQDSGAGVGTMAFMSDRELPVEAARILEYYRRIQI